MWLSELIFLKLFLLSNYFLFKVSVLKSEFPSKKRQRGASCVS